MHASGATQVGKNFSGKGVHEAARIGALAEGGEILATVETLEAADGPWSASEPREVRLKGIADPARVVTVSWR